jgi:hypothetical protein
VFPAKSPISLQEKPHTFVSSFALLHFECVVNARIKNQRRGDGTKEMIRVGVKEQQVETVASGGAK